MNEGEARIPDVSLLLKDRVNAAFGSTGLFQGAPDLTIEIVFSDAATDLERKIELYLKHGSQAVWVAYPEHRTVYTYNRLGQCQRLTGG